MTTVKNPGVKNAGATVALPQQKVSGTIRLGLLNQRDAFWYRNYGKNDLEGVTNESSNPTLGILNIAVFEPSEAQYSNGTIANVRLETVIGEISGIQVKESTKVPGSMYVQTSSRNIAKEGEAPRWINEVKLDRKVQAQILAYVDSLIVPVE